MRIRDLKIYILKNEYDKYIKIIHHFREHIHKLYYYHVINTYEKSVHLNELTDIHKLLNDYYMFDHHKTLVGKTLTEQVTFLKKLESKFGRDKTKTILENVSARNINPDDEDDLTIVELCCRKANYHAKKINYDFDLF